MRHYVLGFLLVVCLCATSGVQTIAQTPASGAPDLFRGLEFRSLGPSLTTGRISDIAVDPRNPSIWYVAAASGGLWKTTNRGTTFQPIFDQYGSYSLGCVTIDPNAPNVIWLGTGENQSQRSVSFGDGVYKSSDGGETWKNVGLRNSEHIAKILVDPRNSNVVYVASQGPLWASGGDRGLFKTTDGGQTWKPVLEVSENTGITDIVLDPRTPDVIYAASYQRRRHVGQQIAGGPEAAIYKSTNAGGSWTKLNSPSAGLPQVDTGRIALAVSPHDPDVVYALIAAAGDNSGFFRSANGGTTWVRQSNYKVVDPQYYGEIYSDPHRFDHVYAVDVRIHVTEDGGRSFQPVPWQIHVDNHAMVFDPTDANHLLVGNDGGLYETWDHGRTWRHFTNLPLSQFYHLTVDNARPFYNVYGGSQDNGTIGGPTRTLSRVGIRTSDWISVGGGDGMQPRIDPENPDIVYSMSQNGALTRLDKRTGVSKSIRPRVDRNTRLRWNWNAPFIISPHSPSRLYLAANFLFRSDDRGESWTMIGPDLTRQIDRDALPVMGRVWGPEAVGRNLFTTDYGVATALAESSRVEGLLYVGTDDHLIQVSEDGGSNWRKIDGFPGVPDSALISDILASQYDANTVYVAFTNHQRGDFKPYLLKSTDRGRKWTSIAGNLPDRHFVWSLAEDHINRNLLFAGTEFGLFFSSDGGRQWTPLRGKIPTIAIRDIEIQRLENDLAAATFGRGFYILDDYTPLRFMTPETLTSDGLIFPVRKTYMYGELGYVRAAFGNETTPNPPYGSLITYYLRGDSEKAVLTVTDASGKTIRTLDAPGAAGIHRVAWDLREQPRPPETNPDEGPPARSGNQMQPGPPVSAGKYKITLGRIVNGVMTTLGPAQEIEITPPL
ncbi:MAG: glycosyl hydrolase [Acidobacteria bacterium]|nr:glycosyl hydrolase [Acidobacteriota bacterium]